MQTMIIKGAEDKITVPIEEVDIDNNIFMATDMNVRSVPTMILVGDDGKEIKRKVGVMKEAELLEWLSL
jgi:thioredoxin-like negative regulator of GroEL